MSESLRPVVVLTTICVVCAALLASAHATLGPRVERQTDLYVRGPALERLFARPAEELLSDKASVRIGEVDYPVFFTTTGDDIAALAVETTGRGGYGGDVVLLIGIDLAEERFLGLEVVSHSETPGLGARVEEPAFRAQWTGLPATQPVVLTTQGGTVDGITGATVTSTAVVDGTNRLVDLVGDHREAILDAVAAEIAARREEAP